MDEYTYKKYINEMLEKISDLRALRLIYFITHNFFIKRTVADE